MTVNDLTAAQVQRIATNYTLLTSDYQTGNVTRFFVNQNGVLEAFLRVTNSLGKKKTLNIFISDSGNGLGDVAANRLYVTGESWTNKDALDVMAMELAQPVFGTVEDEKRKIEQAKLDEIAAKAKAKFDSEVSYLNRRLSQRSANSASFKRELKRYGTEKLVAFLPELNDEAAGYAREALVELDVKQERETILRNPRLTQYTPQLEGILNQIEESVKSLEKEVYTNSLAWLQANETNTTRSFEQQAADYVEQQKAKMLYATIRDLQGLDIEEVSNFYVRNHHNGFEGSWKLTLADGSVKFYTTHTIIAGGYIQRDHYRYLTNLK